MTAFDSNFIFLDRPDGSVEDLAAMKSAGFDGVFCNTHDYAANLWTLIRDRAASAGMFCGPWARIDPTGTVFDPLALSLLISLADEWQQPFVINAEKELDQSGSFWTQHIADAVVDRDCAIIMEPWLFSNVDWHPVGHIPMLLEIFPAEANAAKDPQGCKTRAHDCGIKCVYFTFGTYAGMKPGDFNLQSPYSIYTGNAVGGAFSLWSATSSGFPACKEEPLMPDIGTQHGTTALANAFRDMMPDKTLLQKIDGKWQTLNAIAATPIEQWKAIDKWERAQKILVQDHDAAA